MGIVKSIEIKASSLKFQPFIMEDEALSVDLLAPSPAKNPPWQTPAVSYASALKKATKKLLSRCDESGAASVLVELPTCPICLERMDVTVSGVLTILCHHTFHCACLAKWGDSSCPVCRYVQRPPRIESSTAAGLVSSDDSHNTCHQCGSRQRLWICLICGHIGCGRYQQGHAVSHYRESQHLFALELETHRVWDYAGDGYVHRLILEGGGKLVELPSPSLSGPSCMEDDSCGGLRTSCLGDGCKLEELSLEFSYMMAAQLESQRLFYEAQIEQIQTDGAKRLTRAEEQTTLVCSKLEAMKGKMKSLITDLSVEREVRNQMEQMKCDTIQILLLKMKST